ncbi:MAG TPA: LLM class flavin-dependent oxidoreductase [Chloroflexota bacterium]|nr:LLM class flavin-dependent oxidoreductase [Chloroflexota bacterium]
MEAGIGLPSTIPGVDPQAIMEWARRAEARGLAALGVIDRLVYPNYDPLIALAAAAAVTSRIKLVTAILIMPYRATAVMAKQIASVDRLSGGRVMLGVGLGGRAEDYEAAGAATAGRGRREGQQLEEIRRIWAGEKRGHAGGIGPEPSQKGGPVILVGGASDAAIQRAAKHADGWIAGGGGLEAFKAGSAKVKAAWQEAGRASPPKFAALAYFGLGQEAIDATASFLRHYYAIAGPYAEKLVESALTSPEAIKQALTAYEQAGCQQLLLFTGSTNPDQVDRLAEAVAA